MAKSPFNAPVITRKCRHPGCARLTTQDLCDRHRAPAPTGEWAFAAQLRDELAEARLRRAKGLMTAAAEAVMARDPDAIALADSALRELEQAHPGRHR